MRDRQAGVKAVSLALAVVLCLAACTAQPAAEGPRVWYAGDVSDWDSAATALGSVPYAGELAVEPMVEALLTDPAQEDRLYSPFPAGTRLLGWTLSEGTLQVDLSAEYRTLKGFALTAANYCLTLTLCELPEVERVSVLVEGEPLGNGYWTELDVEQALLSGAEERPVEVSADLYFPRAVGRGLGVEARVFHLTEGDVLAEAVMLALLSGPEDEEFSSAIPEGTQLLSLRLEDGVCYVDFNQALLDGLPEGQEARTLLVYSIVNTLGNLSSVDSVSLLVEGEPLTRLGDMEIPERLEPDFGLAGR